MKLLVTLIFVCWFTAASGEVVDSLRYGQDGHVAFSVNVSECILESHTALQQYINDTLYINFINTCPKYTVYQYKGSTDSLLSIEQYENNMRQGPAKYFKNGRLVSEGGFLNWGKVGIWTYYYPDGSKDRHIHWFHHAFNEKGISIDNTIVPSALTLITVLGLFILSITTSSYKFFFGTYSSGVILLHLLFVGFVVVAGDAATSTTWVAVRQYFFPVMYTLVSIMLLLAFVTMLLRTRTHVSLLLSIGSFVASIALGFFLTYIYIGSLVAGAILM